MLAAWMDDHRRDRHLRRPMSLLYMQVWWNEFFLGAPRRVGD
jgi:hypothetical protein